MRRMWILLRTYLPVLLLVINWIVFYLLEKIGLNAFSILIVAFIGVISTAIIAVKNEESLMAGIIMLVFYCMLNMSIFGMVHPAVEGSLVSEACYYSMYYIFFGMGLEYLIILFIRSLSQDKKR